MTGSWWIKPISSCYQTLRCEMTLPWLHVCLKMTFNHFLRLNSSTPCIYQFFLLFSSIFPHYLFCQCSWPVSRWRIAPTGTKVQPLLYLSLNASRLDWIIKNSEWGERSNNSLWQIRLPHLWRSLTCVCCCREVRGELQLPAVSSTFCWLTDPSDPLCRSPVITAAWHEHEKWIHTPSGL